MSLRVRTAQIWQLVGVLAVLAMLTGAVVVALEPEAEPVNTTASRSLVVPTDQRGLADDEVPLDQAEVATPAVPPAALGFRDEANRRDIPQRSFSDVAGLTPGPQTAPADADLPWDDDAAATASQDSNPIQSATAKASTPEVVDPARGLTPETTEIVDPPGGLTPETADPKPKTGPKAYVAPSAPAKSAPSANAAPQTRTTSDKPTTTTTSKPRVTTTSKPRVTTTAAPTTQAPPTTPAPTTTSSAAPKPSVGTPGRAGYIAPNAGTKIPVYDTAWQMLVRSTPAQADNYFAALKSNGFSGSWTGIIHHAPATYNLNFAGGGQVGRFESGQVVLSDEYIRHARQILDAADRHGMKVGLVAAWQNLYLPGGGADNGVGTSNAVRGTITVDNAYAYGRQIAEEFGDHPAVSMWVFGGDAGTNNTVSNKAVWREMARGVRDAGNNLAITYHTPTSEFDQLNYAGEPWLDFIAPETGHAQDAATTENELRTVGDAYGIPVWQGEPRYFNINFDWVNAAFRNPGVNEVRDDAQAAENAGVSGYVYGDAGRWTWCAGYGDSSPCNPNDVAASFGAGEAAVIEVFRS